MGAMVVNVQLHPNEILRRRLDNQHLVRRRLHDPRQIITHLGAVQSQDFPGALWALAQRLQGVSLEALRCAFDRGDFVRTHVLRPTWHFVAPEDIRWLLGLTAPRIRRAAASRERQLGMDSTLTSRACDTIARALEGGQVLTRAELGAALTRAGIDWHADGGLLAHLVSVAELEAIICSGPLRGAQHTYALLDERVPPAPSLSREEAVAELVARYFSSHGPATLNDFAWWSGLTVADARLGLGALGTRFTSQQVGELTYWFEGDSVVDATPKEELLLLLPNYDEFTVAYRSRELFYPRQITYTPGPRYDAPFGNVIVLGGTVLGIWKRSVRNGALSIEAEWFNPPTRQQLADFDAAVACYRSFLGTKPTSGTRPAHASPRPRGQG
jgi:Winged helix DNA-binding domain